MSSLPLPAPAAWTEARRLTALALLTAVAWLGCEAAALGGLGRSPLALTLEHAAGNAWVLMSLSCAALFYACGRPTSRGLLALLIGGLAAAGLLHVLGLPTGSALAMGVGLAGLTMLAADWLRGPDRDAALALLLPALLVPVHNALNMYFLLLTVQLCPRTCDALLFAADEGLGLQVSFAAGRLLVAVPALRYAAMTVYNTLPMAFLGLYLLQLRSRRSLPCGNVLWPFLVAGLAGFWLYLLFPAAGPAFVWPDDFPGEAPSLAAVLAGPLDVPATPRNCMPSLHTTWALLIWWHARPLGRGARLLGAVYLAFTLLATVGYGHHYVVDLVVAFPFALAAHAACAPGAWPQRRPALFVGAGLAAAWLMALAHALPAVTYSPPLTWAAVAATFGVTLWLEHRLYRAAA